MTAPTWDAVVVGAGPGGASAAYHLAAAGLRVALLERRAFPRDKSCGDGVTRSAARILRRMGVLELLPDAWVIRGMRVQMGSDRTRDFPFPLDRHPGTEGLVVPRKQLDHAICRRAVQVGAVLFEHTEVRRLVIERDAVVGVEATDADGAPREFRGLAVIAADGAMSPLARAAGLRSPPGPEIGAAIRGYYEGISGLDDRLEFYLLITDASDREILPSYGWVFPTGPTTANVGVGLFERVEHVNLRDLMERFVQGLARRDPRFAAARPQGPWLGSPLRFDFDPARSARPGLMLVGDAAGLVSPFTGEGISYALESGAIAADVLRSWLKYNPGVPPSGDDYALRLAQEFSGYFEAGRYSGRRYRLIWQFLRSTFDSERPVHRLCRRMILAPDGYEEPRSGELLANVAPLLPRALHLRPQLAAVAEVLTRTVRRDWPFLTRLSTGWHDPKWTPLRPSLLLLLSAHLANGRAAGLERAGAALELGYLALAVQTTVAEEDLGWGNKLPVLMGELLLARAYALASEVGAATATALSRAVSRAVSGQVRERRLAGQAGRPDDAVLESLSSTAGTLGALPCVLGATLGGADPAIVSALEQYGALVGTAYAVVNEIKMLEGGDPMADVATGDLEDGVYGLAVHRAIRTGGAPARALAAALAGRPLDRARVGALVAETGVLAGVRDQALLLVDRARAALDEIPRGPARLALERIAEFAVSRRAEERPGLEALLGAMQGGEEPAA